MEGEGATKTHYIQFTHARTHTMRTFVTAPYLSQEGATRPRTDRLQKYHVSFSCTIHSPTLVLKEKNRPPSKYHVSFSCNTLPDPRVERERGLRTVRLSRRSRDGIAATKKTSAGIPWTSIRGRALWLAPFTLLALRPDRIRQNTYEMQPRQPRPPVEPPGHEGKAASPPNPPCPAFF